jgi:2'-5' RNA ligase
VVYVDKMFYWPKKGYWCHMWADTEEELHNTAKRIGLRKHWFQKKGIVPHYDLVESKRRLAIIDGAKELSLKDYVREAIKRGF